MTVAIEKIFAFAAAAGLAFAVATPTQAADLMQPVSAAQSHFVPSPAIGDMTAEHKRKKRHPYHARGHAYGHRNHYDDRRYYDDRSYYGEPIYRDTRIWRARDGRYYCRKEDGTTGLLIGAGVGGLIGNEVAGRGDKTLGTLLGAVGGALLGREIDRSNSRCR